MGFNQPSSLNLPAATDVAVTEFRQATYPCWADQTVTHFGAASGSYQLSFGLTPSALQDVTLVPKTALEKWTVLNQTASAGLVGFSGVTGNITSGLPYPIFGADKNGGSEYIYVPTNAKLGIIFYAGSATGASGAGVNFNIESWMSPSETVVDSKNGTAILAGNIGSYTEVAASALSGRWVRMASATVTPGAANFPDSWGFTLVSFSGTLSYTPSAATQGVAAMTLATAVMHLPLVYPVEFSNSALPWYATRTTASALLGTNVSQVLNKGGTILGGRVSPAVQNAWTVSKTYINGLHPAEKAYLPLETGVYTYCPPSTDLVFFSDYTLNTNYGAPAAPTFRLDNDSMYNKMFVTASGVAETLACTVSWHIEFRTSSALFQVGLSAMTLESLHQAQLVLAEAGFFFENPQHDGILNKVINLAKKYAPAAASVVQAVNPVAGQILQSLISRMTVTPKNGPSKPPATSAKSSGIVGEHVKTKKTVAGNRKAKAKGKKSK